MSGLQDRLTTAGRSLRKTWAMAITGAMVTALAVAGTAATATTASAEQTISSDSAFKNVANRVAAGPTHMLAVQKDGTVVALGDNSSGQLGTGNLNDSMYQATKVSGLSDVVAVAADQDQSFAVKKDGTVWAWGKNKGADPYVGHDTAGTLGTGSSEDTVTTPQQVKGLSDIQSISAAGNSAFAVKKDGTLWAWGQDGVAQGPSWVGWLSVKRDGYGPTFSNWITTPQQVVTNLTDGTPITDITAVATAVDSEAGVNETLALKSDGTVWSWGFNGRFKGWNGVYPYDDQGLLGTGSEDGPIEYAKQVKSLSNITSIAAGSGQFYAANKSTTTYAWGRNNDHIIENDADMLSTPAKVTLSNAKVLAVDGRHTVIVHNDGTLSERIKGSDSKVATTKIDKDADGEDFTKVVSATVSGNDYYLAVKADGSVWLHGELGNKVKFTTTAPTKIKGVTVEAPNIDDSDNKPGNSGNTNSAKTASSYIATGRNHILAVQKNGVVAMGKNNSGQLGNGTTTDPQTPMTPVTVRGLSDVISVAANDDQSFAVKSDGTVWAWGNNTGDDRYAGDKAVGILGTGSSQAQVSTPEQVKGLTKVKSISADGHAVFALKSDGTVWAWGLNGTSTNSHPIQNLLGIKKDGSSNWVTSPQQVQNLDNVKSIATTSFDVGWNETFGVKSDGTVWAWGFNGFEKNTDGVYPRDDRGLLGTDDETNSVVAEPKQVRNLTNITSITAGTGAFYAQDESDNLWEWGQNSDHILDTNELDLIKTPTRMSIKSADKSIPVRSINADGRRVALTTTTGTVYEWGDCTKSTTPHHVAKDADGSNFNNVTTVDVGGSDYAAAYDRMAYTIAVKNDGSLWAWGNFGETDWQSEKPIQIKGVTVDAPDTGVPVSSIKISGDGVKDGKRSLDVDKSVELTATVSPTNATDKSVRWTSSDESVATVSNKGGKVTAVKPGKTTITATSVSNPKVTASIEVTVYNELQITGDGVQDGKLSLKRDQSVTLTASMSGSPVNNERLEWKSSDTDIATVDAEGKVTAKTNGKTTITATLKDNGSTKISAKLEVTVAGGGFLVERDGWQFANPDKKMKLEKEQSQRLDALEQKNPATGKVLRDAYEKENNGGGLCYGMSVLSMLIYTGQTQVQYLQGNAKATHDVKEANAFPEISYYHLLKYLPSVVAGWNTDYGTPNQMPNLWSMAETAESGGEPFGILLAYYHMGNNNEPDLNTGSSHEIVGIGAETNGKWTINNRTYTKRVRVYDPNCPTGFHPSLTCHDAQYLYVDTETGYWDYPTMNTSKPGTAAASKELGAKIVAQSLDTLTGRGITDSNGIVLHTDDKTAHGLNLSVGSAGSWSYSDLALGKASGISLVPDPDGDGQSGQNIVLPSDGGDYTLTSKAETVNYSLSNGNRYLTANVTNAGSVTFTKDANARINASNGDWTLAATDNADKDRLYTYQASGSNGGNVQLARAKDIGYILTADNLHNVKVEASNISDKKALTIDTDAKAVQIKQDGSQIQALIDKDGDGVYETVIARSGDNGGDNGKDDNGNTDNPGDNKPGDNNGGNDSKNDGDHTANNNGTGTTNGTNGNSANANGQKQDNAKSKANTNATANRIRKLARTGTPILALVTLLTCLTIAGVVTLRQRRTNH
ncbi:Ig-like domain-containing protein [Bifidobacterium vansinderenii]|uniref:ChiA12 n=1 Tax=Bifidobacterium vansinderenii TaxID=1984871 RepID=A0A229VWT9_9BIFI|nr:Ig-like domain-containing protein [Bifidobacterium vansinderenii]OXN00085.1 ChiA12 [Bifidobacterium vansinderenii]